MFSFAALAAAIILTAHSASAFVFDEAPETGFKIDLPGGWVEKDQGRQKMFTDLGGCWEVDFKGPSKTSIFVAIVRADTGRHANAQEWMKEEVIGLRGKVTKDSFLPFYASDEHGKPYKYSYEDAAESSVKLASGEPATLTKLDGLDINHGAHPNVAFLSFERSGFWYAAVVFNDYRGIEKISDAVDAFLEGTSFLPTTVGSIE
jgi:hypothetical protein